MIGTLVNGVVSKVPSVQVLAASINNSASDLGIADKGTAVGKTTIAAVGSIFQMVGIIVAIVAICSIAITLIITKKQEERTEAMTKVLYVFGGLLLIGSASGIIGYFVSLT